MSRHCNKSGRRRWHGLLVALLLLSACQPYAPTERLQHPRLFFDTSDLVTLQSKAATTHREIWEPISAYVESQRDTHPPEVAPSSGDLDTYRNAGNQLIAFAFACVISNAADACRLARSDLLTYATWQQWGDENQRDLGLAHMLMGNAIAYDWLATSLSPTEQQLIRGSLGGWAQKMYEASVATDTDETWHNWWRKGYIQNHSWTNYSALGMAGLALLGEDPRAQTWVTQARTRLAHVTELLNGVADGSWHEGISYQSYGLTLLLPFLINLRKIQHDDILPHTYLRNYAYWRIYNALPHSTEAILAFGDFEPSWGNSYSPQNILRFIAHEYQDGHAEWMAQQLIAADGRAATVWAAPWYVFEFLYYDPALAPQPPADLASARVFPDLAGVIWRTGWGDQDLIFGFKTGAYGGRYAFDTFSAEKSPWEAPCAETGCGFHIGHDHNDMNGFYLARGGRWLAPETVGVDQQATSLHNTIVIDGQDQYRPQEDHFGKDPADLVGSDALLTASVSVPDFDYLAADAYGRYKQIADIKTVTRQVLFVRPGYLVMFDNLAAETAHQYEWVGHFGESVGIEDRWVKGSAGGNQLLGVAVVAPQQFATETGNDGRPYVRIRPATPTSATHLVNLLYPSNEASWSARPLVTSLDDKSPLAALRVQLRDGSNRSDDILIGKATPSGSAVVGHYQFDGQAAVISRSAQNELTRLFAYGGTALKDTAVDKILVSGLDRNSAFEATYDQQTVRVSSSGATGATLYAPQATRLLVNGHDQPFSRKGDYLTFRP